MFANFPFTTIHTAIIKSGRPLVFWKKSFLTNLTKFTRKNLFWNLLLMKLLIYNAQSYQKRYSGTSFFLWILRNLSELLFIKPLWTTVFAESLILFTVPLRHFLPCKKQCHAYSLVESFLRLICRLGTRVKLIFKHLKSHHRSKFRNE